MTSAPPPASPLASPTLHEGDTRLRMVLDLPSASIVTLGMMRAVAQVLNAIQRLCVGHFPSSDGDKGSFAYLGWRRLLREDR